MPDGAVHRIRDIRKELLLLDGDLIKELDSEQQRKAAGWLMDEVESKLAQIEKLCQNKSP